MDVDAMLEIRSESVSREAMAEQLPRWSSRRTRSLHLPVVMRSRSSKVRAWPLLGASRAWLLREY